MHPEWSTDSQFSISMEFSLTAQPGSSISFLTSPGDIVSWPQMLLRSSGFAGANPRSRKGAGRIAASVARDRNRFAERMASDAEQIQLFDCVPAMLQRLHDHGTRIAIVSSNSESNVRAVLGSNASIISAYSCGSSLFGKSQRFISLLKKLELEPTQACAIGDEVRDIEAAHKAKIAAVAVSWGYGAAETLSGAVPDFVAQTPAEVATFLIA